MPRYPPSEGSTEFAASGRGAVYAWVMELSTSAIPNGDESQRCDWVTKRLQNGKPVETKLNSSGPWYPSPPPHCEQQAGDHEGKGDRVVPLGQVGHPKQEAGRVHGIGRRELEDQQPHQ